MISCESVYELGQTTPPLVTSCPAAGGKSGKGDNIDNGRIFHYSEQQQVLKLMCTEQQYHTEDL